MNLSPKRSFLSITFLIFSQTFFLGWSTYSLKIVSLLKLLDDLSFKAYPPLMIIQGLALYFFMKFFTKVAERSINSFYLLTLITAFFIVFLGISSQIKILLPFASNWSYSCTIFICSSISLLAIEISTKSIIASKISVLQNPKISAQLAFTLEIGLMSGALFSLIINQYAPSFYTFFTIFPFLAISVLFFMMYSLEKNHSNLGHKDIPHKNLKSFSKDQEKKRFSFLPYFIALITIVALLKNIQGFALILGIKKLKETSEFNIKEIFSILSIAQTLIILTIIGFSFFKNKKSTSWVRGFDRFFKIQSLSMLAITFFSPPFMLIATGALRKVTQRGFLNKSSTMLMATIPKEIRLIFQSKAQKMASSISFILLGVLSYLAINHFIPFEVIWILCSLLAILGIIIRKKLIIKLNSFQINTITKFHKKYLSLYDAVNSCYSLANKEAYPHYDALSLLLFWNPRPILTKAIIFSLGEMKNKKNIQTIIKSFHKFPREDIQALAIKGLIHYKSEKVELFVQKSLKNILDHDLNKGTLRVHLCLAIYEYNSKSTQKVIDQYLKIYKNNIIACIKLLELIGERALISGEKHLFDILYHYFHRKYEKITRVKSAQYLYSKKKYRKEILEFVELLKESFSNDDQSSLAYLSGHLKLKENLPIVQKISSCKKSQNPIFLIALIQLGDTRSFHYFLNLIKSFPQQYAVSLLKKVHTILKADEKYTLYYTLLNNHPLFIESFLEILRLTEKDYDNDREIIFNEANKLNIELSEDFTLFNKLGGTTKKTSN